MPDLSILQRWQTRPKQWRDSATWRYLRDVRRIPWRIIRTAISGNVLREGPHGTMWAAHTDAGGVVTSWEWSGPDWRSFASGGAKMLFRLGQSDACRLCVTEAAIKDLRSDTLYLSTGGGWAPGTAEVLQILARRPDVHLVAATDNNEQGEIYARRLQALAAEAGCCGERLRPLAEDRNEESRGKNREDGCRMPAGRLKGDASPG